MLDYIQIGKQVKIARIKAGITQECLADKLGISSVHLSNIERGNTKVSLSVMVGISKALCVSLDVLLCNEIGTPYQSLILQSNIADILSDCTPKELLVIYDMIEGTKKSLRRVYTDTEEN